MMDHNDHVWRWRNEQAGYPEFARKPWLEMLMRKSEWIDINEIDDIDPVHYRSCRDLSRQYDDPFRDTEIFG